MRVLVYGAGGIGLYVAARLAQSGPAVTLKGRSATVEAAARTPLMLVHDGATVEVEGVEVVDRLPRDAAFDLVVVATKAWQVDDAAAELGGALAPHGRVVTTQNGVDAPTRVARHVGEARVLGGTCVVIASRIDPMTVEYLGSEATVTLGSLVTADADGPARAALACLEAARISATWTPNLRHALWKKLALIASYGGVGAISGATVGQTRAEPRTRALVEAAISEVFAVANRLGAELTEADRVEVLTTYLDRFAPGTTASMQRDLAAGLPSELEDQSGAVVRFADELGIAVPVHSTIYASQLPREHAARGR